MSGRRGRSGDQTTVLSGAGLRVIGRNVDTPSQGNTPATPLPQWSRRRRLGGRQIRRSVRTTNGAVCASATAAESERELIGGRHARCSSTPSIWRPLARAPARRALREWPAQLAPSRSPCATLPSPTVGHGRYLLFEWPAARPLSARALTYAVRRGGPATCLQGRPRRRPAHAIFDPAKRGVRATGIGDGL
jgi:hypothetical protein